MDPQIPQKLELESLQKKLPQLQKLNSWTGKPLTNESNGVFLNPTEVERNLNQYGNKLKSLPHQNNNVQQFEHSKPVVLPKVGLPPLRAKPAILPSLPSAELLHRKALPTPSVGEQDRYNITPARMYRKDRLKHLPAVSFFNIDLFSYRMVAVLYSTSKLARINVGTWPVLSK